MWIGKENNTNKYSLIKNKCFFFLIRYPIKIVIRKIKYPIFLWINWTEPWWFKLVKSKKLIIFMSSGKYELFINGQVW